MTIKREARFFADYLSLILVNEVDLLWKSILIVEVIGKSFFIEFNLRSICYHCYNVRLKEIYYVFHQKEPIFMKDILYSIICI